MDQLPDVRPLAGKLNSVNSALHNLGIDMGALQTTVAAFQLIGGSGQIIKGIITAKQAYNSAKLAEGTAHLAKYGPFALAVAGGATAGALVMSEIIDRYVTVDDSDAGMRAIAGGVAVGRGA